MQSQGDPSISPPTNGVVDRGKAVKMDNTATRSVITRGRKRKDPPEDDGERATKTKGPPGSGGFLGRQEVKEEEEGDC